MTVGMKIRKAMLDKGVTIEAAAKTCGMSRFGLASLMQRNTPLLTVREKTLRLLTLLGIDPNEVRMSNGHAEEPDIMRVGGEPWQAARYIILDTRTGKVVASLA